MTEPAPPSAAVASLKSVFPSLDSGVIASVLAEHDGNEDRAVESLLSLTDETFVPPERLGEDTLRAQAELDASYAKALALEEENAAAASQAAYRQEQEKRRAARSSNPPSSSFSSPTTPIDPSNLPYQPRVRKTQPSPYIHQPLVQNHNNSYDYHYGSDERRRDEVAQPGLEERFQKLAVTGQKLAVTGQTTFNSFLNSGFMTGLKDKVATAATNIQQPARQGSNSSYTSPQFGEHHPQQQTTSTYTSSGAPPRTSNPDFPASAWQLPSDDDASSAANSINVYQPSISSTFSAPSQPINPSSSSRTHVSPPSSSTGKRSDELLRGGGRNSPSLLGTSPSGGGTGSLSSSPSAGKIDFAKLGLLPKQRISLDGKPASSTLPNNTTPSTARSSSPSTVASTGSGPSEVVQKLEAQKKSAQQTTAARREASSDDEDLEYTRNPFDE